MKKIVSFSLFFIFIISFSSSAQEGGLQPAFKPSLKMSGMVFFDYFYNVARDTNFSAQSGGKDIIPQKALSGSKDIYGFQFRRIHFTMDYEFAKNFMVRTRLESDGAQYTSDASGKQGNFAPFVKDAYIEWRDIFPGSKVMVGLQPTLAYDLSESVWGFRSVEKTQMDLRGIISSRDIGVSLKGKIDADGIFNYAIMYGNNSGLKGETDKFKRVSALVIVKPVKNLNISLYGDYNFQPKGHVTNSSSFTVAIDSNIYSTAFFVGYGEKDKYTIGAEAFYNITQNGFQNKNVKSTVYPGGELQMKNILGLSVFGYYYFMPEMALILRYDYYDPNLSSDAKGDSRQYIVAGLNYRPDKNFHIIPNIQYEMYEAKPGINGNPDLKFKASLNARITLAYYFSN